MAYADSIRTTTCNMADVATLIEGIFGSTYGLTWSTWTPTYGAYSVAGSGYTPVTTTYANYIQVGKLVLVSFSCTGTVTTNAATYLTATLPVNSAVEQIIPCTVGDGGYTTGRADLQTTVIRFYKSNFTDTWATGAGKDVYVNFFYKAA